MSENRPVKHVLIAGGGVEGWLAAAYVDRRLGCPVTVLEPAGSPAPSTAEATLPTMTRFVFNMKIDEDEFMRRCHAAYNLGTRYVDWIEDSHVMWHPIGMCGGYIDDLDLFHFWSRRRREGADDAPYWSYSLQALLGERARSPRPYEGTSPPMKRGEYAYLLDSNDLAGLLKQGATQRGVESCEDEIRDVVVDDRGHIERVETVGGRTLTADLYLDCTGPDARLAGALGDPWIDWSHLLPADRGVVVRMPRDAEMHPRMQCTATTTGWRWEIPLSHHLDVGHVYSRAHVDDDTAARDLVSGLRGIPTGDPRFSDVASGRRTRFWTGNCIALGSAGSSLDPVEPTRLHLVDKGLELLVKYFPDCAFHDSFADAYNRRMGAAVDEIRDFVLLHYLVSRRDEPFWRDARDVEVPDTLEAVLGLYDETGIVEATRDGSFSPTSFYHVLSGGGRLPRRPLPLAEHSDLEIASRILDEIRQKNHDLSEMLPAHRALMEWLHGSDL